MKKVFSIMIISLMILSCFTISASAESSVTFTFTASEVDATTNIFNLAITADKDTVGTGITIAYNSNVVVPLFEGEAVSETGNIDVTLNEGYTADDNWVDVTYADILLDGGCTGKGTYIEANSVLFTVPFKKLADITENPFTITADEDSECYDMITGTTCGISTMINGEKSNITTANEAVAYRFVLDAIMSGDDEPASWKDTVAQETEADVKFPVSQEEKAAHQADDNATLSGLTATKKIVVFAKNVSTTELKGTKSGSAAEYGVTIGGAYYPGYLNVPANESWAIIVVDPNGDVLTKTSYSATVKVGSETKDITANVQ